MRAGRRAEQLACNFLIEQGLECLCRNHRCRRGEIDLVMRDQRCLIMVEVRYRATSCWGSPAQSITHEKRRRLARAALDYLRVTPRYAEWPLRFDLVSITGDLARPRLEWSRAAMEFDGEEDGW